MASLFESGFLGEHSVAVIEAAGSGMRRAALADAATGELLTWADAFGTLHVSGPWCCPACLRFFFFFFRCCCCCFGRQADCHHAGTCRVPAGWCLR